MHDQPTLPSRSIEDPNVADGEVFGLILLWSHDELDRVGEALLVTDPQRWELGRGRPPGDTPRLEAVRQRPGENLPTGPLLSERLSRRQLAVTATPDGLAVENIGQCPLRHNGAPVARALAGPGDTLELLNELLMLVVRRPRLLRARQDLRQHPFGRPDAAGIVGESPAAWRLREQLGFVARRDAHVLIHGPSGSGKELIAAGIHAGSRRRGAALIARNAATLPPGIVDAELFGNVGGYPNPGMAERPGLIGAADGGVLFLDEFAELPEALQAHLLRVLDAGEYHRLGEGRARHADLRLVAATNRPLSAIKEDVLARMPLRIQAPPLGDRLEDTPLLALHLLRGVAGDDPELAGRFFEGQHPRLSPALVRALIGQEWRTHVRQLQRLLWASLQASPGAYLTPPPEEVPGDTHTPAVDPTTLSPEVIQEALDRHGGRQSAVWKELGLSSRHVLKRLLKKHGLSASRDD